MINIREIQSRDVDTIMVLHLETFPGFFLSFLGSTFLKCYYACFVKSSETVSVCAEEDGKMLGFDVSTKIPNGFNGRLIKQNMVQFGGLAMKLLLTSPKALLKLVKNFSKTSDVVENNEDYAELFSIGVSPFAQDKGVGRTLLVALSVLCICAWSE